MKKQIMSTLLCALLSLTLCACAPGTGSDINQFDATAYVDGLIKEYYLGQFDESFLEMVGITEEDAEKSYHEAIHMDVDYFTYLYGIEYPTDEYKEELETLFEEIYTHTKYEIVSAAKQDDGSFSVKVNVDPIDIVQLCEANWDKAVKDFNAKYTTEYLNSMSDAEYQRVDAEWAKLILDLYKDKMKDISNEETQSILLQLELDEDGYYTLNNDDFARLDNLIIDWASAGNAV